MNTGLQKNVEHTRATDSDDRDYSRAVLLVPFLLTIEMNIE